MNLKEKAYITIQQNSGQSEMLNYIWGIMIISGILWGAVNGNIEAITEGILGSTKEAVNLCITMLGIMSFWNGIMKVGEKAGFIHWLSKRMSPFIRFMFPRIPVDHPANRHIATNIIANILGLGWAATPAGLKAMEELAGLEEYKDEIRRASDEMCTFLVINISSLQLIPVNIIAYRSQYNSSNPTMIVGPAILATIVSTIIAILFCKLQCSRKTRKISIITKKIKHN